MPVFVQELGELRRIDGADWNLEMGAITELLYEDGPGVPPAVLFDNVPGYSAGYRALFGLTCSVKRMALTLGLEGAETGLDPVSYTHLRAHETKANLVCRLL